MWDTYKSFMLGKLIVFGAFREKIRSAKRDIIVLSIQDLESKLKEQLTHGQVLALDKLMDELKLMDVQQVAQEVAYGRQVFAYSNKPGIHLARVLSEESLEYKLSIGGCMDSVGLDIQSQLEVFRCYYKRLYKSES